MRNLKLMMTTVLTIVSLGACELKIQGTDNPPPIDAGLELNEVPAAQYYRQFLYTQNDGRHQFLTSEMVKISENGRFKRFAAVDLFLYDSGRTIIDYREYESENSSGEEAAEAPLARRRYETNWRLAGADSTSVEIIGLGIGRGLRYNNRQMINFSFDRDLVSPGLQNKSTYLRMVDAGSGLE
jgi:hypothetical protein